MLPLLHEALLCRVLPLLPARSCPIYEATRRGLGAALLRKPAKLAKLVRLGG